MSHLQNTDFLNTNQLTTTRAYSFVPVNFDPLRVKPPEDCCEEEPGPGVPQEGQRQVVALFVQEHVLRLELEQMRALGRVPQVRPGVIALLVQGAIITGPIIITIVTDN